MTLSRREFLTLLGGTALLAPGVHASAFPLRGTYALAGVVHPGRGAPMPGHAVLVRAGRIEGVVPAKTVADRPILAPENVSILPGVINAHCHTLHSARERRERWLLCGVTSIGDAASPLDALPALLDSPPGTTATASTCGPMLCPPGGYPLPIHSPKHGMVAATPRQGADAVKRLADLGVTRIKIAFEPGVMPEPWPLFDPATAAAICDEAHRLGLGVRCHVEDLSGLGPALDAGVSVIEHVPHRWNDRGRIRSVLTPDDAPAPYYLGLLERMVRDGVTMTPTLDVFTRTPWNGPALFEPVRAFHAMGGRIALGNDFPYRRTEAGMPVREMRLLARAGLDKAAVLEAATVSAAEVCGFTDRGVIAPGMAADLLMVRGEPGPDALKDPLHIVKEGVFIR
ncbi:amidohydrolase family protein [Pseudodesulfovibrio thermohalotolerans]|uniref:amidohydrolase family protein n=1 Tax=Pseudodesulfovibrio thermohalotolerans TaxID=2880651 RepID=UPI00244148AC|nr:amidohydrolase family protein [Pseudodesulfovibrio thermohalotolerans]WFS62421.1 amidohydrolase family protein [Pseudodesulfovibrio thermohalotolerans]